MYPRWFRRSTSVFSVGPFKPGRRARTGLIGAALLLFVGAVSIDAEANGPRSLLRAAAKLQQSGGRGAWLAYDHDVRGFAAALEAARAESTAAESAFLADFGLTPALVDPRQVDWLSARKSGPIAPGRSGASIRTSRLQRQNRSIAYTP